MRQPKVLLFDIGGVCVISPFQTILNYEVGLGIPPGWINFSLSKTAPNGYWHRLERGEISMDSVFFTGFNEDLHDLTRWKTFYQREQQRSSELSDEVPPLPSIDGERLFNEMMLASSAPDPWMFPALKALAASENYIIAALSNTVIFPPGHPLYVRDYSNDPLRRLFDVFVSSAHVGIRKPDPKMYQLALDKINEFATKQTKEQRTRKLCGGEVVEAGDILFLDDIGENLKAARQHGFRTLKVPLGKAYEAVEELEKITGLAIAGNHPKAPLTLGNRTPMAKI